MADQSEYNGHPDAAKHTPAPHVTPVANPAPLGLLAFGTTTFVLSCYNAGIFGVSVTSPPNAVVGLAVFYGGLAQLLAGMWEFKCGNTFGATIFTSYASFWLSYAAILIPWFGVADSFVGSEQHLGSAVGIFLLGWALFSLMMWFGTFKANVALCVLFVLLTLTFTLLSISEFKRENGHRIKRAGGFFGIFAAIVAWYTALAGLLTRENSFFTLPVGPLKKRR